MTQARLLAKAKGKHLIGRLIDTQAFGIYPGGPAKIIGLHPDSAAPEIVIQVFHPTFGAVGIFENEEVRLLRQPSEDGTKVCRGCGERKKVDLFYADANAKDGRFSLCKLCLNAKHDKYRKEHPKPFGISREYSAQWAKDHPEERSKIRLAWNKKNPDKRKANRVVASAVQGGRLPKPSTCDICGEKFPKASIHGHHDDYKKRLAVRWLCPRCHKKVHAEMKVSK
jgi:hypothetical protein